MHRQSRPPPTHHTHSKAFNTSATRSHPAATHKIITTRPFHQHTTITSQHNMTKRSLSTSLCYSKQSSGIPTYQRPIRKQIPVSNPFSRTITHSRQQSPISDPKRLIQTISVVTKNPQHNQSPLHITMVSSKDPLLQTQTSNLSTQGQDLDPHGGYERLPPKSPDEALLIKIIDREGKTHDINCKVGDNVLFLCRVLQETIPDLYLEGACEASLGCSTCHVIFDEKTYNYLEQMKPAHDDEEDMLDLASCLTPTSRLGCQIFLTKEMNGAEITLPKFSRNFYVDGHIPQPH